MEFLEAVKNKTKKFKQWLNEDYFNLYTHLDADGLTSGAIMINLLNFRKHSIINL